MAIIVSIGGMAEATPEQRPYEPRGAAVEAFYAHEAELLMSGPAGTGKSRALLEVLNLRASKYPGSRHLITRKTRTSLNESGLVTLEEKVLPPNSPIKSGPKRRYRQVYDYPNGSTIVVAGMDDPARIMSTEFDTVFAQEATEFTEEDWDNLTTRLRNGVLPYQLLTADCNPGSPRHWLKKRVEAGKCRMLESRHEDNPLLFDAKDRLTPYGAAYLAKLDNLSGVRYLRLRKGLWVMAEGMVYTDYDPASHLIDRFEVPRSWPRYWVIDFGFTNPFCWQAWTEDPDGRLYRYREIYQTRRLVEDHAIVIRQVTSGEPTPVAVICDHDAEDRATLERHLGLGTIAAYKSISDGLQAVAARLRPTGDGKPRLFLLRDSLCSRDADLTEAKRPTCAEEEFESYCFVAGTLVGAESGQIPIEEVKAGDKVWTRRGLRPVAAAGLTDASAAILTVDFSDGRRLSGTANHPIFVKDKGWTALQSLSSSDIIEEWEIKTQSSSMASHIGGIQTRSVGRIVTTSAPLKRIGRKARRVYTSISGNQFMVKFRQVVTFTTWMATRLTTRLAISPASRGASTSTLTAPIRSAKLPSGWPSWTRRDSFLRNGHEARKGELVPANDSGVLWRNEQLSKKPAFNAKRSSQRVTRGRLASARALVTQLGVRLVSSITSPVSVLLAGKTFKSTDGKSRSVVPVRVVRVTAEESQQPVYNLTVEECPEYYANGVLVHNCWAENAAGVKEKPVDRDNHGLDCCRYMVAHLDLHASLGVFV